MALKDNQRKPQLVCTAVAFVALLTHVLALVVQPSLAASSSSQQGESGTAATSTQPLWSYQVKPSNYVGVGQGAPHNGGYPSLSGPASLFDAFTGLSQRQGALTSGSPFLSILPIILIAAGGLLLLLPMLTMMMASPFGGGAFGGGGYQNYGYPQVSGLNKRRSLDSNLGGNLHKAGLIELIEHVSSTIEDLSRKYAPNAPAAAAAAAAASSQASTTAGHAGAATAHKRSAKALNSGGGGSGSANNLAQAANHQPANELSHTAANHKPAAADAATDSANGLNNLVSGSL